MTMHDTDKFERINCPYCDGCDSALWASENGFDAVKCSDCGFIYVNPRPRQSLIDQAVQSGTHSDETGGRNVVTRRIPKKVDYYRAVIDKSFPELSRRTEAVSWLDIGAGFGELVEAVMGLAPEGSVIEGIEPMRPKAEDAQNRGLRVRNEYLETVSEKYDCVSLINVYSHIPDFPPFLCDIRNVLNPGGQFFIETGNAADLASHRQVAGDLDLPDHLVFAGEKHLTGQLEEAGFKVTGIVRMRRDGFVDFLKGLVKKALGRNVHVPIPYTSPFRQLFIRAELQ